MKMKIMSVFILFLLALVVPNVAAQAGYQFTDVDVNGIDMANSPIVYVARDEIVHVKLDLEATEDAEDLKVKAWIGGYEYGDVKATTEMFDVEEGVTYPVILAFRVPKDIDASKEYTLHIEAYDKDDSHEEEYVLRIKEKRHLLDIQDVIFSPGLTVENTEPLFVVVRLENMGENKEEDIRVEVSIPELGISQRTYVDELTQVDDDDEESSESSDSLYLDLEGVEPGVYKLIVTAEYNRGHDIVGQEFNLVVKEGKDTPAQNPLIVGTTQSSKLIQAGAETTYQVSIANLGEDAVALTAELAGVDSWSDSSLEPELVVVPASSKSDILVKVTPNKDAQGKHQFLLTIKDQDEVVKQVALEAVVRGKASTAWSGVKTGLEIAFIVLLVIAVILAIIIGIQKASTRKEEETTGTESSLAPEPATYY